MRTEYQFRLSWLYAFAKPFSRLRYVFATPSARLRGRSCKELQLSNLRFDSPLDSDLGRPFLDSSGSLECFLPVGLTGRFRCSQHEWCQETVVPHRFIPANAGSERWDNQLSTNAAVRGFSQQWSSHAREEDRPVSETCNSTSMKYAMVFAQYNHVSDRSKRRSIMSQSRGAIRFDPLFTTADIGLRQDASVEHVVKAFLHVGEALASRWIEMPRGILLLQTVPDEPASGAIYLYDREGHIFFLASFLDGKDDALTEPEFDQLVVEYDLVSCAANPSLLSHCMGRAGNT